MKLFSVLVNCIKGVCKLRIIFQTYYETLAIFSFKAFSIVIYGISFQTICCCAAFFLRSVNFSIPLCKFYICFQTNSDMWICEYLVLSPRTVDFKCCLLFSYFLLFSIFPICNISNISNIYFQNLGKIHAWRFLVLSFMESVLLYFFSFFSVKIAKTLVSKL